MRSVQGRDPRDYTADVIGCEAHRRLAREAAQKSIVLLKNEGPVLPLAGVRYVAVIGWLADTPNTGDRGSSSTQPAYVVTPLQGLGAAAGAPFNVIYSDGSNLSKPRSSRRSGARAPTAATGTRWRCTPKTSA